MSNINRVIISGRLTRDPDVRTTAGGTTVMGLGVAVNDRRRNQQTGQWEDYTSRSQGASGDGSQPYGSAQGYAPAAAPASGYNAGGYGQPAPTYAAPMAQPPMDQVYDEEIPF